MMNGSFPHRSRRGTCGIWTSSSTLWVHVAQALGFTPTFLSSADLYFTEAMRSFLPDGTTVLDVIFSDCSTLSSLENSHWQEHLVPHVFTIKSKASSRVPAPRGWKVHELAFTHASVGGSTVGGYTLGLLLLEESSVEMDDPPPMTRHPWAPLGSLLDGVNSAASLDATLSHRIKSIPTSSGSTDYPVLKFGGVIHSQGLAPWGIANLNVVVPCVYHENGVGVRKLLPHELAALSDTPILLIDRLKRQGTDGLQLLRCLSRGHPSKVLFSGADYLLSTFCRGGFNVRNTVKSATSGESDIERLYDHIRSAQVEVITPDPEESSEIELELSAIESWMGKRQMMHRYSQVCGMACS